MNKSKALNILSDFNINVTYEEILFPKHSEFPDEVHDAIDFLIDKFNYGVQYV
jgi:hypothetical protein